MLSRVADSLYWMSRHIERAENIARLLDVNIQLMLDFHNMDKAQLKEHWDPIVRATGDLEKFESLYKEANSYTVTDFLTFNMENPNSIQSCICSARENARMIRDQLPADIWEKINEMYLFLRSQNAREVWKSGAYEFYQKIKDASHLIQGLTDSTFTHSEGYLFMQVGKFLERADKTTRIIDIKYHILLPDQSEVGGAIDAAQWVAVLRSCSAYNAYHRIHVADMQPWKVTEFLILSNSFPRSIRFCVKMLDSYLRSISGSSEGQFANEAERLSGKLMSELNYSTIDDIFKTGLHEYLDLIQLRLNEIGKALFESYMFYPPVDMAKEIHQQQQQQ